MNFIFLLLAILLHLAHGQNPSPCPDTFTYEPRGKEQDRWYGVISIRSTEDLVGVYLNILLDRPAQLLGNWFGDTSSVDNTEFTVINQKYKLEAGPPVSIRFFVKYNPSTVIPSIKSIRLNGRTICPARDQSQKTTTERLHLSQTMSTQKTWYPNSATATESNRIREPTDNAYIRPSSRPSNRPISSFENQGGRPNVQSVGTNTEVRDKQSSSSSSERSTYLNNNDGSVSTDESDEDSFFVSEIISSINSNPSRPITTESRPTVNPLSNLECGTVAPSANALISNGEDTKPGQWPWHTALYYSKGVQLLYSCGATLITQQHVLTAAHCVTKPHTNDMVNKRILRVYLGKYNLIDFNNEVQERGVSKIDIHPNYNYSNFFNDIAVLQLSKPVEINNYVRSVCLWDDDSNLETIVGRAGTVVGWGFDQNKKLSSALMRAQMPVVSTTECMFSNRDFFPQFVFENNFCAGFKNGTSACNGDSGGGMVFQKLNSSRQNPVWQIRGIVSVGVALQNQGLCDTKQYIVFTDVAKYTHWIRQIITF